MTKQKLLIGIDPDTERSGVAFKNSNSIELSNLNFFQLFDFLSFYKEREVNGEKFVPHIKLGGRPNLKDYDIEYLSKNIDNMSYGLVSKLIEWHFDIHGLIEKGLAIDINTL